MSEQGFGAFGKIPAIGDFFRIDAPSTFVSAWDNWLQRCMVSGAHTFGSRWDELYMSVPIWRFCLAANLAGPDRMIGVLMPSVDRVGRRFPLTLMATLPNDGLTLSDHLKNSDLFASLEDIALSALDDDASRDGLQASLSELNAPASSGQSQVGSTCGLALIQKGAEQSEMVSELAARLANAKLPSLSVWSAVVEDDTRVILCDGLPEGPNMQGLFDLDAPIWTEGLI